MDTLRRQKTGNPCGTDTVLKGADVDCPNCAAYERLAQLEDRNRGRTYTERRQIEEAPEKIYADRGPQGGWLYREQRMPDTQHEYIRADIVEQRVAQLEGRIKGLAHSDVYWICMEVFRAHKEINDTDIKYPNVVAGDIASKVVEQLTGGRE